MRGPLIVRHLMKNASESYRHGIVGYRDEQLVSTDFIHDARWSIHDWVATQRRYLTGQKRFLKLVAWCESEWGYANRVVDRLRVMEKQDGATVGDGSVGPHAGRWQH